MKNMLRIHLVFDMTFLLLLLIIIIIIIIIIIMMMTSICLNGQLGKPSRSAAVISLPVLTSVWISK